MSGLWRQCCPDCGEATCDDMCDESWNDSYALSNLSGSYTYSKVQAVSVQCLCKGQGVQSFVRNWSVTVNWVQELPIVITRQVQVEGVCCYYGEGEVTVSASVVIEEFLVCCDTGNTVDNTTEISRSLVSVPICVSLTCGDGVDECQPLTPGAKMTLNVCMCDFPLQGSVELTRPVVDGDQCSDELEPEPEIGLVMGGICWYYEARLVRPDLMVGGDRSLGGVCSTSLAACDVYGSTLGDYDPDGCMPCVRADAVANGPFAIYAVEPFTLGVDDPGTCSCPGGIALIGVTKALVDCGSNAAENCSPCVSTSVDTDCCEVIVGKDLRWPVFT
jgi:hypothetical protein